MPTDGNLKRFDRSRIAPAKAKRDERSHRVHRLPLVNRQEGIPENSFGPDDETSDDDELNGESDDDGEDSGDEEDGNSENPFAPATGTASKSQPSIAATTTTPPNPFEPASARGSVGTSTPAFFTTSSTGTQTSISGATSTGLESVTTSASTLLSPNPTTSGLLSTGNTVQAAPVSTTTAVPEASNHPIAKAAIIVPSVVGSVAAIAAIYLLFRYCVPLRARWTIYRARRGQRLPEEEDGMAPTTAPQMTEAYATKTATEASRESLGERSIPSTPITLAPSFTQGTAVALPMTNTRVPPPVLVRNFSKSNAQNPRLGQPTLSRSNSGNGAAAPLEGYGTYAFNFDISDYAASGTSDGHQRHPSGLENNPPTPIARKGSVSSDNDEADPMPTTPSAGPESEGIGMNFPLPPTTPSSAHFGPKTPPESVVNYYSPPRLRKSITPSESVSNVPDSPFPFSPGLAPPMPAFNSRWSNNSSSVNGRVLAEALNIGPSQDGDIDTAPNGRPLSQVPSLRSSSSPVRRASEQI
ncbi:hypothetical protein, variant [Phialophora macrospora]|uniref:Uncharacterized protein n=1 Tax=Phialophora macrospora TaxID=1851006 RepID=A0A0D2G3U6_9EURO|nr:hypothetical protein, variant [Phialophora macrospora]